MNNNIHIPRTYVGTNNAVYNIGDHRVEYNFGNNKVEYNENSKIVFYYPKVSKYPVDVVSNKIVLAMETRNWQFPDIKVTFQDTQIKNIIYRKVRCIETLFFSRFKTSHFFSLYFGREQGLAYDDKYYHYKDYAAINRVSIPGKTLEVYGDGSGPHLVVGNHVYSGRFENMPVNSKAYHSWSPYLNYERENYIVTTVYYIGGTLRTEHKDYPKINVEPNYYETDKIFQEFKTYLEEHVLKTIEEKK